MPNTRILYLEADKRNFADKFLNKTQGFYQRNEDGKIDYVKRLDANTPWIHQVHALNQKCHFYHHILFNYLHSKAKVPIPCQQCWKVVIGPRTVKELMATYLLQKKLSLPSKCGIEGFRDNTDRLYGGYWYNKNIEDGQTCYKLLKAEIEKGEVYEGTVLGAPIKAGFMKAGDTYPVKGGTVTVDGPPMLILKRGCTEMEQNVGPSDTWKYDQAQQEYEDIASDAFVLDYPYITQGTYQIAKVIQAWLHSAYQWGDLTYLEYTNGNRLFNPPVTYHDKKQEDKENG